MGKFYDSVHLASGREVRFSWLDGTPGLDIASRRDLMKNIAEMEEDKDDIKSVFQMVLTKPKSTWEITQV